MARAVQHSSTLARGVFLLLAGSLFSACSTSRIAVHSMVPILENSKSVALASNDIRTFYSAAPANLFLLEGLIKTEPGNEDLRIAAAMMYFSYAFAFDDPSDSPYASSLFLKGFEHGRAALLKDKKIAAVWDQPFDAFVAGLSSVDQDDMPALVWTVANWSQFIGLHLDSTEVLLHIPRVTALLDRAVALDGAYFEGLPYMILGSLHAFRPPMMGGDPEASLESFERAFETSGRKFLLAQYLFAKFYCHRVQDPDLFEKTLSEVLGQPDTILPEYRLLNAIARNKAAALLKEKDDLF